LQKDDVEGGMKRLQWVVIDRMRVDGRVMVSLWRDSSKDLQINDDMEGGMETLQWRMAAELLEDERATMSFLKNF